MKTSSKILLVLLLCLNSLFRLWGAEEKLSTALRGGAITTASTGTLTIKDQDYGLNAANTYYHKTAVHAILKIDERTRRKYADNWRLTVSYSVKLYGSNGQQLSYTPAHSLVIDHMRAGSMNDVALNLHQVGTAQVRRAMLTITSLKKELLHDDGSVITSANLTALNDSLFSDVVLELQYIGEKYRPLNTGAPAPGHWAKDNAGAAIMNPAYVLSAPGISNNGCAGGLFVPGNEITFYWPTIEGAESYDLEYLFIDAGDDPLCGTNYDFDWADAIRVNTTWNFHRIPLLFPRGKVVYRVRAVGINTTVNVPHKIERGPWSSGTGTTGNTSMNHSFTYSGLEPGMNWTSNVQYAEEGKSKSTLAFFDGIGNARQALTYSNTDSLTIISESTHDHAGRNTLTLLPSIHDYTGLSFMHNLNPGFDKSAFDKDTVFAPNNTFSGIAQGTATGDFYSPQNPFLNYTGNYYPKMLRRSLAAYQADAEGFPFVHKRFSNDGLGRIQAEAQPGFTHRLGGGHDTRYYYGAPGTQAELDRLFGNEVGYVGNYRKEMVIDANGQVSIQYKDGYDRTIATALAGTNVDEKLHLLPSSSQTPVLTADILDNNHLTTHNELEASKALLVSVPNTQYTIHYQADTLLFRDMCLGDYSCAFEISISLIDEEGHHLLDFDNNPGTTEPSWRPFNAVTGFTYNKTVSLPEIGKYTLVKRVRLNDTEINTIRNTVSLQIGTDTSTAGACFVSPAYEPPCTDCHSNCEASFKFTYTHENIAYTVYHTATDGLAGVTTSSVLSAVSSEGNTPLFGLITQGQADSIEALILECKGYCNQQPSINTNTECDVLLAALKSDMAPGGQYFDNRPQSPTVDTTNTDTGYYEGPDNNINSINHWLYNYGGGYDLTFGSLVGIANAGWDTVRARWDDITAAPGFEAVMEQFVQIHPEYCIWKARCEGRDDTCACSRPGAQQVYFSINQYEDALYATNDDSTAREQMLFLPLGTPSAINLFNPTQVSPQDLETGYCFKDPLIECNDPQATYTALVSNYLTNYLVAGPETLSLWEVLTDPNGIHLLDTSTYSGPIPNGLIAYLQILHGNGTTPGRLAPFGQVPAQGQLSLFTFFRSAYEAVRLQIKQQRGSDAFAGCAPAGHPLLYLSQHTASAPVALQPGIAQLPYLSTLDADADGTVDIDLSAFGMATPPGMDHTGFQIRMPFLDLQLPPTYNGLSANFCQQMAQNLPSLWISDLESSLNGCVRLNVSNPDTVETLPYLIPSGQKSILHDYFEILIGDACTTYTASLITVNPLPAIFTASSAPVSVYSNLPWGTPATNTAQEIVNLYMAQTGTVGCPPVGHYALNDTAAANRQQELSCDCGKLRDVIYATGGLKIPYTHINPFKYGVFTGVPAADIFNTSALLSYLGNMDSGSLSPYDSTTLYAGGVTLLMDWIDQCSGNLQTGSAFMDGLRCETPTIPNNLNNCAADYVLYYRTLKNQTFLAYRDSQLQRFNRLYEPRCLERLLKGDIEEFTISYSLNEYHYTLYYYDRAGNLVKTVPPQGVSTIDNAQELARIDAFRKKHSHKEDYATLVDPQLGSFTRPAHGRSTHFVHNSKEQVIRQLSPDGGEAYTYYDFLGRPALGQNAKQKAEGTASYTLYDGIGRIYENGEWLRNLDEVSLGNYSTIREMVEGLPDSSFNYLTPFAYLLDLDHNRRQITRTYYDHSYFTEWNFGIIPLNQKNLRNRIATSAYYEHYPSNWKYFDNAQHFSYDIHGNVNTLVQDVPQLQPFGKRFLKTEYEYDLISGKTNAVHFMRNQPEHYSHYYHYDGDNRLIRVETSSNNGVIKETEAKYYYFPTGPLARIELARKQVQGIDYSYALNGWIKGVNTDMLNPHNDRGKDGLTVNNLHSSFGVDAMGYSLNYYKGDYIAVGSAGSFFKGFELSVPNGSLALSLINFATPTTPGDYGLYNGNITKMVSNTLGCNGKPLDVLGRFYQYDQLNRLMYSNSLTKTNSGAWNAANYTYWNTPNSQEIYATETKYDGDGNITQMIRTDGVQVVMDNLVYNYEPTGINNALLFVKDNVTGNTHTDDIKDQGQGNYSYDGIGNLTSDLQNDSAQISWNLAGKVQNVNFKNTPDLWFTYDPNGHRILKRIDATQQRGATLNVYALDAQGNTLGIYTIQQNNGKFKLSINQRTIYGSERLGIDEQRVNFSEITGFPINELENSIHEHFKPESLVPAPVWEAPTKIYLSLGQKQYELGNHLGNVLATVSDRKVFDATEDTDASNELKRYRPEVRMATEYYPFGSPLPDWGCSQGIQCTTEVITQTGEITLSNFVNNVQKSGSSTTMPDCGTGAGTTGSCVRVEMPHKDDIVFMAFKPNETGTQELTTSITFLQEDYLNSLRIFLVEMDAKGSKVVDTVFTGTVTNNADTVKQKITYFNGSKDKVYRIGYRQSSTGLTKVRWLNVKLLRVTETYVRNCGNQGPVEGGYLYQFNGKEKTNEINNIDATIYDYGFRIYDTRIAKFLSVDPLTNSFPWYTPYQFAGNKPIWAMDLDGLEEAFSTSNAPGTGVLIPASDQFNTLPYTNLPYFKSGHNQINYEKLNNQNDLLSYIPGFGIPFDLMGAVNEGREGNYFSAAISIAGVTAVGDVVKGAKLAVKNADEVVEGVTDVVKKVETPKQLQPWQKTEAYETKKFGGETQKVFKDKVPLEGAKRVKGGIVVDNWHDAALEAVELKNYFKSLSQGKTWPLINNIVGQFNKRMQHLPPGSGVRFKVDITEYAPPIEIQREIRKKVLSKIEPEHLSKIDIKFFTRE